MPVRNISKLGPKRYPYMLRGRVEVAIFNCPRCNEFLKFRGTTVYRKRCPKCYTVLYVFLRVCVGRGTIVSPKGVAFDKRRPLDTILPIVLTPTPTPASDACTDPPPPPLNTTNPLRAYHLKRAAINALIKPLEGDPNSLVAANTRKLFKYQPAGEDVDQFVAELGELGIENSIECLPSVGLGRWRAGELAHRLVDLDELRERGEVLRVERIEDSDWDNQ